MAKRSLEVVLDASHGSRSYVGGEVVRGEVVVRVEKDTTCKSLMVEVGWSTHGRGNRASDDVYEENLFIGDWRPGEYRYPFEATLPHGPYTYHGHYLNVDWYAEARADVPWAFDPKDEVDFELVPSDDPLPATHPSLDVAPTVGFDMTAKVGFGVGAGSFLIAGVFGLIGYFTDPGLWMFSFVMAAVGLFMAMMGLKAYMTDSKLGEVKFELEPVETWPGGQVLARLAFTPKSTANVNAITIKLTADEVVVSGSGTNRTTYTHAIHSEMFELSGAAELRAGQPVEFEQMIMIPRNAPYSFDASDNDLRWKLVGHIDIAKWPDWKSTCGMWVGAKRESGW